jgi:hypothetical protein
MSSYGKVHTYRGARIYITQRARDAFKFSVTRADGSPIDDYTSSNSLTGLKKAKRIIDATHGDRRSRRYGSAVTERATFVHEGKAFTAGGAHIDTARGIIQAYVTETKNPKPGEAYYYLTTWKGKRIAPLKLVSKFKGGFGRATIWAWRTPKIRGHVYSGRNAGPAMIITLRAKGAAR